MNSLHENFIVCDGIEAEIYYNLYYNLYSSSDGFSIDKWMSSFTDTINNPNIFEFLKLIKES